MSRYTAVTVMLLCSIYTYALHMNRSVRFSLLSPHLLAHLKLPSQVRLRYPSSVQCISILPLA
jgi:hypothetical protein